MDERIKNKEFLRKIFELLRRSKGIHKVKAY